MAQALLFFGEPTVDTLSFAMKVGGLNPSGPVSTRSHARMVRRADIKTAHRITGLPRCFGK